MSSQRLGNTSKAFECTDDGNDSSEGEDYDGIRDISSTNTPRSISSSISGAPPIRSRSTSLALTLALPEPIPIPTTSSDISDAFSPLISPTTLTNLHGLDLNSPLAGSSPGRSRTSEEGLDYGVGISPINRSRTLPRQYSTSSRRSTVGPKKTSAAGASESAEPAPLDAEKRLALSRWIVTFAVVNFDLDLGPVVERLYPEVLMTSGVRENIAFSAFPDASLFETGVQCHSFRIRDTVSEQSRTSATSSPSSGASSISDGFLYGYALFLQKRDASSKRGYLQRSVVILSHLAYPSLFTAAVSKLGAFYFSHGVTMLETACYNIASWPDPTRGTALALGFLGDVMDVEIPRHENEHQSVATSSFGEKFNMKVHMLASLPTSLPSPISLFASFLPKVWALWECLVLSEPLLIFAPSPSQTSAIIWWLRDFLRPIPLAGDFRPYFHIHDQDYANLVNKNPPKPGLILGVTNPFFTNLCKHWPHVLSVGREEDAAKTQTGPQSTPYMGPAPGFHSKHQRFISKDRNLLKKLEEALHKGGAAEMEACNLLRQHFTDRTTMLLVPLNRHFASLIPTDPNAPLKPFTPTSFLASLKVHGSMLPFRSSSKQKEFYVKWLRTPAFGVWLTERVEEVQEAFKLKLKTQAQTQTQKLGKV
ncbi:hypothetical protein FRB94_009032 [Tulasnella sp. JGI-2019a]|nr:hypothetical protein FRB94_009032 [Tulasnella sp. JGI-2019a]